MESSNQPVVIDNGSGVMKCGFAGIDMPSCVFPTYVGRPKHRRAMVGALEGDTFIGKKAEENRGLMTLKYPMQHGIVEDWNDMERIWNYIYVHELKINSEQHPVLLTEAPLNPTRNREKAAEIFFETFNVPSLYISMQAVLSLYASGRTTGVVLDSGDGVTHAVPVYEGFALQHCISRIDLAGRDVTDHLNLLMRKAGYRMETTAEREVIKILKEKVTFLAASSKIADDEYLDDSTIPKQFKLPDGSIINIARERYRAPEILFRPSIIGRECVGVHQVLTNSIRKADLDMRKILYSQIVLSGGSTMFPGYGARLLSEVKALAPPDIKIRITAPPERLFSTWMGGSILGALSSFKSMCITAEEYSEGNADFKRIISCKDALEVMKTCKVPMTLGEAFKNPSAAAENTHPINPVEFVDVRELEEIGEKQHLLFNNVMPVSVVNSLLAKGEKEMVDKMFSALDKNKKLFVICKSGRRSAMMCQLFDKYGYQDVNNIVGGMDALAPLDPTNLTSADIMLKEVEAFRKKHEQINKAK